MQIVLKKNTSSLLELLKVIFFFSGSRSLRTSLQWRRPPAETAARWRTFLTIKICEHILIVSFVSASFLYDKELPRHL